MSDIITDLETYYGRIRLLIGDTEQGKGILPRDRNFLDAELEVFYLTESTGTTDQLKIIGRAAAAACEAEAAAWAAEPYEEMLGPHRTKTRAVKFFQERAVELRKTYGNVRAPGSFQARLGIYRAIEDAQS